VNEKVFLSESLHCKESVEGESFGFDGPCIAELATSIGSLKKFSIGQHHDNGQNVFHLIKVTFSKLGHKFRIEPDFPFKFTEDVVRLVKNLNILDSFQIGVKIFDQIEFRIELIKLSVLMMTANQISEDCLFAHGHKLLTGDAPVQDNIFEG
jgi:hypothetical protein